jgi:hypothetical protein
LRENPQRRGLFPAEDAIAPTDFAACKSVNLEWTIEEDTVHRGLTRRGREARRPPIARTRGHGAPLARLDAMAGTRTMTETPKTARRARRRWTLHGTLALAGLFAIGACVSALPEQQAEGCPAGLTRCDGACVAVGVDPAHCSGCGQGCPLGELCSAGQCSGAQSPPCKGAADCASSSAGPVCDLATGACVVCATDADCPETKKCNRTLDACTECARDGDCGAGKLCRDGACEPGCTPASQCPDGQICDPVTRLCVGCLADADCPTGTVCEVPSHACVECAGDDDCPPGDLCHKSACAQGCVSSHPCPKGEVCDLEAGACVACLKDADCKDPGTPRCDPKTQKCVACLPAADNCPLGEYCEAAKLVCEDGCKSDDDCLAKENTTAPRCLVATHDCVECLTSADCPADLGCTSEHECAVPGAGNPLAVFHRDLDGDGFGDPAKTAIAVKAPPGYVTDGTDCDDAKPNVHPAANEICNGLDDDCDGTVDEGVKKIFYADVDGDGYGNAGAPITACTAPPGFVADATDCNDADPLMNPGLAEICDARDNDCNGLVDEGVKKIFYADVDSDGYGDAKNAVETCKIPAGFVENGTDCDDTRSEVHPGAAEQCNNRDDDCDGMVDGQTRSCENECGAGVETCTVGAWGGCTAPVITTINTSVTLSGQAVVNFDCLDVTSVLKVVDPDTTINVKNWVRVRGTGTVRAAPRTKIVAGGDVTFSDQGYLAATEVTIEAPAGTVSVSSGARINLTGDDTGRVYSSGGGTVCSSNVQDGKVGGASGGARGGTGGKGGECGLLPSGQPTPSAGGTLAWSGYPGCDCVCTAPATAAVSAGGGGATMSGGGGGANGGPGAGGVGGVAAGGNPSPGTGGAAEPAASEPLVGGGGGGSGGRAMGCVGTADNACGSAGGHGGGLLRIVAEAFVNKGIINADGSGGVYQYGTYSVGGGGGGGGGGSLVFRVGTFDNTGMLSAIGGAGGNGKSGACGASCENGWKAGGGGGGGGGRIYIGGPLAGGVPMVSGNGGTLFVAGGVGGPSTCGLPTASPGADGWVHIQKT